MPQAMQRSAQSSRPAYQAGEDARAGVSQQNQALLHPESQQLLLQAWAAGPERGLGMGQRRLHHHQSAHQLTSGQAVGASLEALPISAEVPLRAWAVGVQARRQRRAAEDDQTCFNIIHSKRADWRRRTGHSCIYGARGRMTCQREYTQIHTHTYTKICQAQHRHGQERHA